MGNALTKETKFTPPRRGRDVVRARPANGDHKTQVDNAFTKTFDRHQKAFQELAKV